MVKELNKTQILINEFRNKACAWQSQGKAYRIHLLLKEQLNKKDYDELMIAWGHYMTGEGAEELYDVCKILINKYT